MCAAGAVCLDVESPELEHVRVPPRPVSERSCERQVGQAGTCSAPRSLGRATAAARRSRCEACAGTCPRGCSERARSRTRRAAPGGRRRAWSGCRRRRRGAAPGARRCGAAPCRPALRAAGRRRRRRAPGPLTQLLDRLARRCRRRRTRWRRRSASRSRSRRRPIPRRSRPPRPSRPSPPAPARWCPCRSRGRRRSRPRRARPHRMASAYRRSAISVFVWRNAFGRTRKRRPRICSSIASSPQSRLVGRFVTSAGVSLTAQWIDRTSGNLRSVSTR